MTSFEKAWGALYKSLKAVTKVSLYVRERREYNNGDGGKDE